MSPLVSAAFSPGAVLLTSLSLLLLYADWANVLTVLLLEKNSSFMLYTYAFTQTPGFSVLSHKTLTSEVPKVETACFTHCGLWRRGFAEIPHGDKIFSRSSISLMRKNFTGILPRHSVNKEFWLYAKLLFPYFQPFIQIYLVKIIVLAHLCKAITQPKVSQNRECNMSWGTSPASSHDSLQTVG